MSGIAYVKGDAACPQAKGVKISGEWSKVEPLIEDHLCGSGVAVTVYDFE